MTEFLSIWLGLLVVTYILLLLTKIHVALRAITTMIICFVGVMLWIDSWATDALDFWVLSVVLGGTPIIILVVEMSIGIWRKHFKSSRNIND